MCPRIGAGGGGNIQCIVLKIKYRRGLHRFVWFKGVFFKGGGLHSPIEGVVIYAYLKQAV